jgi:hypothetical protein
MKKLFLTLLVLGLSSVALVGCKAEGQVGDPDKMSTNVAPL